MLLTAFGADIYLKTINYSICIVLFLTVPLAALPDGPLQWMHIMTFSVAMVGAVPSDHRSAMSSVSKTLSLILGAPNVAVSPHLMPPCTRCAPARR